MVADGWIKLDATLTLNLPSCMHYLSHHAGMVLFNLLLTMRPLGSHGFAIVEGFPQSADKMLLCTLLILVSRS